MATAPLYCAIAKQMTGRELYLAPWPGSRQLFQAVNEFRGSDIIAMAGGWLSPTRPTLLICLPKVGQVPTGCATFRLPAAPGLLPSLPIILS